MKGFAYKILGLFAIVLGPWAEAAEDTRGLVELLGQAQKANEARYPAGRLRFTIDKDFRNGVGLSGMPYEKIECEVEWRGNQVHTKLYRSGSRQPFGPTNVLPRGHFEETILNESEFITGHENTQAFIDALADRNLLDEQRITPRNQWYRRQLAADFPMTLTLEKAVKKAEPNHVNCLLTSDLPTPTTIHFVLDFPREKERLDINYSLEWDGNLTSFEDSYPASNYLTTAVYQWARDASGRIYLRELNYSHEFLHNNGPMQVHWVYRTVEFDPTFQPAEDAFKLASLKLKPGAVIYDDLRKQTYRLGEPAPTSVFSTFDGLAGSMRARGFAAPGR